VAPPKFVTVRIPFLPGIPVSTSVQPPAGFAIACIEYCPAAIEVKLITTSFPISLKSVIRGSCALMTVTVNVQELEFPLESFALQVTMVTPSPNIEPLSGAQMTGTAPSQLSTAEGVIHVAVVVEAPRSA
jgi:hypothetical protein